MTKKSNELKKKPSCRELSQLEVKAVAGGPKIKIGKPG